MDSKCKVIQIGDICIEIGRLTVGQQLERTAMVGKFVHDRPSDSAPEDPTMNVVRWNLICLATQTRTAQGIPPLLPKSSDTVEEFDGKLAQFLEMDNEVAQAWMVGMNEVSEPLVPRTLVPKSMLTEAELADPKSGRPGGRRKNVSG